MKAAAAMIVSMHGVVFCIQSSSALRVVPRTFGRGFVPAVGTFEADSVVVVGGNFVPTGRCRRALKSAG